MKRIYLLLNLAFLFSWLEAGNIYFDVISSEITTWVRVSSPNTFPLIFPLSGGQPWYLKRPWKLASFTINPDGKTTTVTPFEVDFANISRCGETRFCSLMIVKNKKNEWEILPYEENWCGYDRTICAVLPQLSDDTDLYLKIAFQPSQFLPIHVTVERIGVPAKNSSCSIM